MKKEKLNKKIVLYLVFLAIIVVKSFLIFNFKGLSVAQTAPFIHDETNDFSNILIKTIFQSQNFFDIVNFTKIHLIFWTILSTTLFLAILRLAKFTLFSSTIGLLFFNFSLYWLIEETDTLNLKIKLSIFLLQILVFFLFLKNWQSHQKLSLVSLLCSFLLGLSGIFSPDLMVHSLAPMIAFTLVSYRNGHFDRKFVAMNWSCYAAGLLITIVNWGFLTLPNQQSPIFQTNPFGKTIQSLANHDYEKIYTSETFPVLPSALSASIFLGLILVVIESATLFSKKQIRSFSTGNFSVLALFSLLFILLGLIFKHSATNAYLYALITLLIIISIYPLDHFKRTYLKIKTSPRNYLKVRRAHMAQATLIAFSAILLTEVYFQWQFFTFNWQTQPSSIKYLQLENLALIDQLNTEKPPITIINNQEKFTSEQIGNLEYLVKQLTTININFVSKVDFFQNENCKNGTVLLPTTDTDFIKAVLLKCPEPLNQKNFDYLTILSF